MFQVDRTANRIHRLDEKRFGDLAIREREHLQEWLAEMPSALGEDLLIIQKEFDGFDETRERLDLLALDKTGQLVVIENKLDDSGRDVVWQALKYVAYSSSLTKSQIVEITQAYLDRHKGGGDARAMIAEFLDEEDIDEVVLNAGNHQRLIFVAAHFRKEVTTPVLWLISHGISAQCFKVTPFPFGEELFIDIQQIIPVPEAEEFMIGFASKETECREITKASAAHANLLHDFWRVCLEEFATREIPTFENVHPSYRSYLTARAGIQGCELGLILRKNRATLSFNLNCPSQAENKRIFDYLHERKAEVEEAFRNPLNWQRKDHAKSSSIDFSMGRNASGRDDWREITDWMANHIVDFANALLPHAEQATQETISGEKDR